jgi:ParB family chromosome partitioning protein
MSEIHLIPLAEIDESALARDRTAHDAAALDELALSIAASGLRMPIEIFALSEPHGPRRYALISGYRRLSAFRALHAHWGLEKFAAIPAFLRAPRSAEEVYVQMVEENAIRADLSPWEQALAPVRAARAGAWAGTDAALDALYANLSRFKRARLRAIAHLAEELDGHLAAPESLSERQLLRLAALIPRGYADLIRATLSETPIDPEAQWRALLPILTAAERPEPAEAAPSRPDTPRRTSALGRPALVIRREPTRNGWCLHFAGRGATSSLLDSVIDRIEYLFSPEEPRDLSKHLPPAHTAR